MDASYERISPERLCEVAEAVLHAAYELAESYGESWPYPPDLMDTDEQPECLEEYTKHEVDEGTMFLIRLGIIKPPRIVDAD